VCFWASAVLYLFLGFSSVVFLYYTSRVTDINPCYGTGMIDKCFVNFSLLIGSRISDHNENFTIPFFRLVLYICCTKGHRPNSGIPTKSPSLLIGLLTIVSAVKPLIDLLASILVYVLLIYIWIGEESNLRKGYGTIIMNQIIH
jgi:hypothetical protein